MPCSLYFFLFSQSLLESVLLFATWILPPPPSVTNSYPQSLRFSYFINEIILWSPIRVYISGSRVGEQMLWSSPHWAERHQGIMAATLHCPGGPTLVDILQSPGSPPSEGRALHGASVICHPMYVLSLTEEEIIDFLVLWESKWKPSLLLKLGAQGRT